MVEVASLSSAYRTRRISTVGIGEGHAQLRNQHLPSFGGRKRRTEAKGNLGYRTQGQCLCESEQKHQCPHTAHCTYSFREGRVVHLKDQVEARSKGAFTSN